MSHASITSGPAGAFDSVTHLKDAKRAFSRVIVSAGGKPTFF